MGTLLKEGCGKNAQVRASGAGEDRKWTKINAEHRLLQVRAKKFAGMVQMGEEGVQKPQNTERVAKIPKGDTTNTCPTPFLCVCVCVCVYICVKEQQQHKALPTQGHYRQHWPSVYPHHSHRNKKHQVDGHAHLCVWVRVYVCLCVCVSVCVCVCKCVRLYMCEHRYVCLSICLCVCMCVRACVYVCVLVSLRVCFRVCVYVCVSVCAPRWEVA